MYPKGGKNNKSRRLTPTLSTRKLRRVGPGKRRGWICAESRVVAEAERSYIQRFGGAGKNVCKNSATAKEGNFSRDRVSREARHREFQFATGNFNSDVFLIAFPPRH